MEIFIRGLVALGIALAVATFAWSQAPVPPAPAAPPGTPVYAPPDYGPAAGMAQDNGTGWSPFMEYYFQRRDAAVGGGHLGKTNRGVQFPSKRLFGGRKNTDAFAGKVTTQPGTLVFPQHPFARSPRDFFMLDQ